MLLLCVVDPQRTGANHHPHHLGSTEHQQQHRLLLPRIHPHRAAALALNVVGLANHAVAPCCTPPFAAARLPKKLDTEDTVIPGSTSGARLLLLLLGLSRWKESIRSGIITKDIYYIESNVPYAAAA